MNPFRYSIWLVPCAEQRTALQQTINELSAQFGTPSFAPHATLCSGVWKNSEVELIEAVEKVGTHLRGVRPSAKLRTGGQLGELSLPMKVDGIDWAEDWSTFFFLRLECKTDLFEQASRLIEGSHPPEIGPHLSLLYDVRQTLLSAQTRRQECLRHTDRELLRLELAGSLPETIRFDSLALIRPATGRWEDVQGWEAV